MMLIVISSCSTPRKSEYQPTVRNRDCNSSSDKLLGKNATQQEQRLNDVTFNQCAKNESVANTPYEVKKSNMKKSSVSDALMYKCEVNVNGNNYATSNKIRENAKERVRKKCLRYENNDECLNIRCVGL